MTLVTLLWAWVERYDKLFQHVPTCRLSDGAQDHKIVFQHPRNWEQDLGSKHTKHMTSIDIIWHQLTSFNIIWHVVDQHDVGDPWHPWHPWPCRAVGNCASRRRWLGRAFRRSLAGRMVTALESCQHEISWNIYWNHQNITNLSNNLTDNLEIWGR